MFINKLLHERYERFTTADYISSKKRSYTHLLGLLKCLSAILENKNICEPDGWKDVSFDPLILFLEDSANVYTGAIKNSLKKDQRKVDDAKEFICSLSHTLEVFAKSYRTRNTHHTNYSISSTLSDVLKQISPPTGQLQCIRDLLKTEHMCLDLSSTRSPYFKNIVAYAYCAGLRGDTIVISFFAELGQEREYVAASVPLESSLMTDSKYSPVLFPDHLYSLLKDGKRKAFFDECTNIVKIIYNCLLYIKSPSKNKIVQEKIAAFSPKKSKREYQQKNYSNTYTALDIEVKKIRAYEHGKSWYRKGHPRWQPCGVGRKDVKLIFLAPQTPQRRKLV